MDLRARHRQAEWETVPHRGRQRSREIQRDRETAIYGQDRERAPERHAEWEWETQRAEREAESGRV